MPERPRQMSRKKKLLLTLLVLAGAAAAGLFYLRWQANRDYNAAVAETEQLDPRWRWEEILADRKEVPDDANGALVVVRTHALLTKAGGLQSHKWDFRLFEVDKPEARLNEVQFQTLSKALGRVPAAVIEARKLKDYGW